MKTDDASGEANARKLCGWNTVSVSTVASAVGYTAAPP